MISAKADDIGLYLATKLENGVHATLGVRASVDVVTQEYDRVAVVDVVLELTE
jgi:hypothetical protein